jgi:formylglycine-generating enzyme required for sulfatase activity
MSLQDACIIVALTLPVCSRDEGLSSHDAAASHAEASTSCLPEMVLIPGDTIHLGGAYAANSDRWVKVDAFCLDKFVATIAQYAACTRIDKCAAPSCEQSSVTTFPITCVTAGDAEAYCQAGGKRLATADELEYAARGADQRFYPWGNTRPPIKEQPLRAVSDSGNDLSPFGVVNLGSNVASWSSSYLGAGRVAVGGSWRFPFLRSYEYNTLPTSNSAPDFVGIRCAKSLKSLR